MASNVRAGQWRWWRLESGHRLAVDATARSYEQIALAVTGVGLSQAQSLPAVEARYYGVDRPEFGADGQIHRIATRFQLDVLTDADLTASWVLVTRIGETAHPPDAYGPGTTLAVWRSPAVERTTPHRRRDPHPSRHDPDAENPPSERPVMSR